MSDLYKIQNVVSTIIYNTNDYNYNIKLCIYI